jgi:hypothetical protein
MTEWGMRAQLIRGIGARTISYTCMKGANLINDPCLGASLAHFIPWKVHLGNDRRSGFL